MTTVDLRLMVDDAREMDDQSAREIEEALSHTDDERLAAELRELVAEHDRLAARLRDVSQRVSAQQDRTKSR